MTCRPGQSGNRAGTRLGAQHRDTQMVEALMRGDEDAITRSLIIAALGVDMVAARTIFDRLAPAPKGTFLHFKTPKIGTPHAAPFTAAVLEATAAAGLTASEAADLANGVMAHLKAIETSGLTADVAMLKELVAKLQEPRS